MSTIKLRKSHSFFGGPYVTVFTAFFVA